MASKPKIQYVGQFYVYGSEAQKLEQPAKKPRPKPAILKKLEQTQKVHIDLTAITGIAAAVFLLTAMVAGCFQLKTARDTYKRTASYVSLLKWENAQLKEECRKVYDLDDVQKKATAIGMIPKEEAKTMTVHVRIPTPEKEPTFWENLVWFWQGLFE